MPSTYGRNIMADISFIERRKLERLFRMGSGYVLGFSDRTFSDFFEEHIEFTPRKRAQA